MLCAAALIPATSRADVISVGDVISLSLPTDPLLLPRFASADGRRGGPFKLTNYSGGSSFATFCLELNEPVSLAGEARYRVGGLSDAADRGGTVDSVDPLDIRTAYVYYAFRVDDTGTWDPDWEGQHVQEVIWHLENELTQDLSDPAQSILEAANALAAGYDFGGNVVRVINLVDMNGNRRQDLITYLPVPEPGLTLMLGAGLMGLAAIARRRMKPQAPANGK
jgi:hypothetical protein